MSAWRFGKLLQYRLMKSNGVRNGRGKKKGRLAQDMSRPLNTDLGLATRRGDAGWTN